MKNRTLTTIAALSLTVLLQGCAKIHTVQGKSDYFEEDDYSGWEKSDWYFEQMEAELQGNVMYQLPLQYSRDGRLGYVKQENTLGHDVSDAVYVSTIFASPITPVNVIGTLLGVNNDSPDFGSPEARALMNQNKTLAYLSGNSISYVAEFEETELPQVSGGLSKHHALHLAMKERFLQVRHFIANEIPKAGATCQFMRYNESEQSFERSPITINPLSQYLEGYDCKTAYGTFQLESEMYAVRGGSGYKVIYGLTLYNMPKLTAINSELLYQSSLWQSMMKACRTCDPKMDRVVEIKAKSQDKIWLEKYQKGTIYR